MQRAEANEAFVRHVQARLGLTPDGWAGDRTRAAFDARHPASAPAYTAGEITERVALELIGHEAIVREAYKDSERVWTWGIGVTNASGHQVHPRYKDNPQTIARCIEIYVWLCRTKYGPEVVKAFAGHPLTEAQFAAALSFHYNTGAIQRTDLVGLIKTGKMVEARKFWTTHYLNGGDLQKRRNAEAALFFDGKWSSDGKATVYEVNKPSYAPRWSSAKRVDIQADLKAVLR